MLWLDDSCTLGCKIDCYVQRECTCERRSLSQVESEINLLSVQKLIAWVASREVKLCGTY